MAKTERIYIRVSEELKQQLQLRADAESRTLTNYIEKVLIAELKKPIPTPEA